MGISPVYRNQRETKSERSKAALKVKYCCPKRDAEIRILRGADRLCGRASLFFLDWLSFHEGLERRAIGDRHG
jgi:hypothetical protein